MGPPLCAAPSWKLSNATRRVPLLSHLCFAVTPVLRRWPSISAAIRKPKRSMSARMIWKPTMNSPAPEIQTMTNNNLATQLKQIGLRAVPAQMDDFIARATKARWSPLQILEELTKAETAERSRRSLERRLRISGIKRFKPMADFRLVLAHQDRTGHYRTCVDAGFSWGNAQSHSGGPQWLD